MAAVYCRDSDSMGPIRSVWSAAGSRACGAVGGTADCQQTVLVGASPLRVAQNLARSDGYYGRDLVCCLLRARVAGFFQAASRAGCWTSPCSNERHRCCANSQLVPERVADSPLAACPPPLANRDLHELRRDLDEAPRAESGPRRVAPGGGRAERHD